MKDISLEWIKKYVDELLEIAKKFEEGSAMRASATLRASFVMDMVDAWREAHKQ